MKHLLVGYRIAAFVVVALTFLVNQLPFAHAAGVVWTCDEASLDAALAGGGTITFACSGTITVTSTKVINVNTTIDGSGQNVTISGGGRVQIINLIDNADLDIRNLTVSDGFTTYGGVIMGSIPNSITVSNSIFTKNSGNMGGSDQWEHNNC